ncbi:MAG: four-carbon acid sugar kinase family protein [Acidobacteriaceae bacterium]|nr:four-carbon acid sugar kinase family protein [Acidobacteriaceae bacterium]
MLRLLVIADDLSGAADSAIACTRTGLSAMVTLRDTLDEPQTEVLAIDCDTRDVEPQQAAECVARILSRHVSTPDLLVFKKIDSTFRGNIGAELAELLRTRRNANLSERPIVIVLAPAFPAGGRTTVDAHQFVHGVPLQESETWTSYLDKSPTHLPSSLKAVGLRVVKLGLGEVRAAKDALMQSMTTGSEHADLLFCDSETDDDLHSIAEASMGLGRETIWAGSAGLAYHLPHAAGLVGEVSYPGALSLFGTAAHGPILIIVGTMSSVARRQVEALAGVKDIRLLPLAPSVLLAGPASEAWCDYSLLLADRLRQGGDSIVMLEPDAQLERSDGPAIAKALGAMLAPHAGTVGALVASGGETARSVLDLWDVTQLRIIGELEPGLPVSVTEGWRRPLLVVTKAGAFGTPQTFVLCIEFLRARMGRPDTIFDKDI